MKTGIELIAEERNKQLEKHKRTPQYDAENNSDGQLAKFAALLVMKDGLYAVDNDDLPEGWNDEWCHKMLDKPYLERVKIAGALLAAELDRMQIDPDHAA